MDTKIDNYNSEEKVQSLANKYAANKTDELRDAVIACYEPYILKYVDMLCGKKDLNIYNPDTRKFLQLFIGLNHRNDTDYPDEARKFIHLIRRLFVSFDRKEIYNYVVMEFTKALARYKPMIARHRRDRKLISFTHYIQIRIRFGVQDLIRKTTRDTLIIGNVVEYNDDIHSLHAEKSVEEYSYDLAWVLGRNNTDLFRLLSCYDRYVIYILFCFSKNNRQAAKLLGKKTNTAKVLKKFYKKKLHRLISKLDPPSVLQ